MHENQNIPDNEQQPAPLQEQPQLPELKNSFHYFPFRNHALPIFILMAIGFLFNYTSLKNEYALDDGIIIHQNDFVIKGVSGIPDILTKDTYASFYARMNASDQLTGGRYQPLSVISFAIEQQIIGAYPQGYYTNRCWDTNRNGIDDESEDLNQDGVFNEIDCQVQGAFMRHFNNVLAYILGCILLFLVFRNHLFKERHDLAFLSALIFMCHPLHTENVANIRGRADIFCLIFMALSFLYAFRYLEAKNPFSLLVSALMFFLAMLSKEFAIMLLPLIPISFFVFYKSDFNFKQLILPGICFTAIVVAMFGFDVKQKELHVNQNLYLGSGLLIFSGLSFTLFRKQFLQNNLNTLMLVLYSSFLIYLCMRLAAVVSYPGVNDSEILNNPYLLATGEEKFCTKFFVLAKYFYLMWVPHPLISDYSFNTIEYLHFTDYRFIVALLLQIALVYLAIRLVLKRHLIGFAIAAYLLFFFIFSNIINTGVMMNEHLAFYSVMGFAILVAWLILEGLNKLQNINFTGKRGILFGLLSVLLFLYGCKTWERNYDWKNDITLFLKDVYAAPNSVLILGNAGARWIDLADIEYFINEGKKGNLPYSTYTDEELNIIVDEKEFKNGLMPDSIILPFKSDPFDNPQKLTMRQRALYKGVGYLKHAVALHPRYVNGYLNLGLAYYKLNRQREMFFYWKMAEHLYPDNPYLKNYYTVVYNQIISKGNEYLIAGKNKEAIAEFNKCITVDANNPEAWLKLGDAWFNLQFFDTGKKYWLKARELAPDNEGVLKRLNGSMDSGQKPENQNRRDSVGC